LRKQTEINANGNILFTAAGGGGSSMALDGSGNIFVPDYPFSSGVSL